MLTGELQEAAKGLCEAHNAFCIDPSSVKLKMQSEDTVVCIKNVKEVFWNLVSFSPSPVKWVGCCV